jgi:ABC-type oligopeptide transport system ATPase subunit
LYGRGPQANQEQFNVIERIHQAAIDFRNVKNGTQTDFTVKQRCFFITGEGGSGKTFTYNVMFI